jgi:hypothetical protein
MHPAVGWFGGLALGHAIAGVVMLGIAVSPTAEPQRRKMLRHAEKDVLAKLSKMGQGPSKEKLQSLRADLKLLRTNVETGWVTWPEQRAGIDVIVFVLGAHSKATLRGIWTMLKNDYFEFERGLGAVFDSIFVPTAIDRDQEGNVRA